MTIKDIENGMFFANDDPHSGELKELVSDIHKIELNDHNTYNVIRFIEYCKKSKHFSNISEILDNYFLWLWETNKEDRFHQMILLSHEDICIALRKKLIPEETHSQELIQKPNSGSNKMKKKIRR